MCWAGCQNNLIDVNFYNQNSLEIFEKKAADKNSSNKDKVMKMSPPAPNKNKSKMGKLLCLHNPIKTLLAWCDLDIPLCLQFHEFLRSLNIFDLI